MNLVINGKKEAITQDAVTVVELLKIKNVEMPEMVSVQLNGDILIRKTFNTTYVNENDEINFLYFMGGGGFDR